MVDRDLLKAQAERHCGELMRRFYPEIDGPPRH